ncbi:MAG: hypothetical protein CBD68_06040 [Flavobacteriaceae bacterium TMED208]|nr:MAG: hypothetical protein CBD68_06040 [Flavobacteriaceae bacterium TMED208]
MHIAGKIFLGLGLLITLAGVLLTIGGGSTLDDVGEWDVEGKSQFDGPDGTWEHDGMDWMIIYVSDDVDCETFSVTYTNETGATGYSEDEPFFNKEECNADGTAGVDDDPSGYYSVGEFRGEAGEYTVDGTHEFYTVGAFEVILEEGGEAVGGFFAAAGGIGTACCGIFFLLLGGIFALVLKEPKKTQITGAGSFTTE